MPLARIGNKIVFFAHIPKTGGGSIEEYLAQKGPIALHYPRNLNWSASTPQHMPAEVHEAYIPSAFYDRAFTVMRDPLSRMISEYRYRIGRGEATGHFNEWAQRAMCEVRENPFVNDSHLRPQSDFLRPNMVIFRFEKGLSRVYDWIDRITETSAADRLMWKNRSPNLEVVPSEEIQSEIEAFYAADSAFIAAMGNRNGMRWGAIIQNMNEGAHQSSQGS